MDKKYIEIDFVAGVAIEECVEELLVYKRKGILAYGLFNGTPLFSDTVTIDSAYKDITGKTKSEIDKEKLEWLERYRREEEEHLRQIPELSKYWMKKGREILEKDKWNLWDEIVPVRLNDIYRGSELEDSLEIIKVLNSGKKLDEARSKLDSQNHSGASYSIVCAIVKEFCYRGEEFINYIK